ncbi:MAG: phenylalanine--tRNA ligase subunit beta [Dehalococcoidales bacterium]|nr:phenylalanine--tRNA ligase subunit beta [Dehalococcoidales bacterium]
MRVSVNWLKKYVPIDIPEEEAAYKITMASTEVSETIKIGDWKNVHIAKLVGIAAHPNADKLRLATVEMNGKQFTVVCGAPNLTIGDKVCFAQEGAVLKNGHTGEVETLKTSKIRGVESSGMLCSKLELGLSEEHDGILILPEDAPEGMDLGEYLGDTIWELDVTPNRPDMFSILGVAHELASLTDKKVTEPEIYMGNEDSDDIKITNDAPDLCPVYSAAVVKGIKLGPSPAWMQDALVSAGMRPINNVVDITNYVMLEYGQPLHAFDYDTIKDHHIIVRRAKDKEEMVTLDNEKRTLDKDILLITDADQPLAVAGVMGGLTTEVTEKTVNLCIESANFSSAAIHHANSVLKMSSEAGRRFERSISARLTDRGLRRAVKLILDICGGTVTVARKAATSAAVKAPEIDITKKDVENLLGMDVDEVLMEHIYKAIGCEVTSNGEGFHVVAPYWRSDIKIKQDLIEEYGRIVGYDKIPFTKLSRPLPEHMSFPMFSLKSKVKHLLCGLGASEIMTISITNKDILSKASNKDWSKDVVTIANPMASDQDCLRTSLRSSVLTALVNNLKYPQGLINIYEVGHTFFKRHKDTPVEIESLCGVVTVDGTDKVWNKDASTVDFYDVKGMIESLMRSLKLDAQYVKGDDVGLHPGYQAEIRVNGNAVGVFGKLHPVVANAFELSSDVYLYEIDLNKLLENMTENINYSVLTKFPTVDRDLALVVEDKVTHQQIMNIIAKYSLIKKATLFDCYTGEQIEKGKKSLAYSLVFQSNEGTLKDAKVDGVMKSLTKDLADQLGAAVRGA